jgi:hypothetical protein
VNTFWFNGTGDDLSVSVARRLRLRGAFPLMAPTVEPVIS